VTEHSVRFNAGIILFIIICFSMRVFPQRYPDPQVDSLIESGIHELINQDYAGAKNTFNSLDRNFPSLPAGKIFIAAADIAKSIDYSENISGSTFGDRLSDAQQKARTLLEKNPDNVWYRYFLALAEGYISYYDALNGSWLSAFSKGLGAVSDFNACLKLKPDFYDAYTAVGTYRYWRSRKTSFLNWLPFVGNDEEEGIKDLKLAIDHKTYHRYIAMNSLLWIYIDQKKYRDAKAIAEKALKDYPDSRQFKWGLARAYEGIDLGKSILIYSDILNSYKSIKGINRCNEITLMHIIAQIYNRSGEKEKALNECNEILSITDLTEYEKDKLDSRLDRVKQLKNELVEELSK